MVPPTLPPGSPEEHSDVWGCTGRSHDGPQNLDGCMGRDQSSCIGRGQSNCIGRGRDSCMGRERDTDTLEQEDLWWDRPGEASPAADRGAEPQEAGPAAVQDDLLTGLSDAQLDGSGSRALAAQGGGDSARQPRPPEAVFPPPLGDLAAGPLTPGPVRPARSLSTPGTSERPSPTTPESRSFSRLFRLSSRSEKELGLSPEDSARQGRSVGGVGGHRSSPSSWRPSPDGAPAWARPQRGAERRLAGKCVQVEGHAGSRPEINGVYATACETWSGRTVYRNRVSQAYMIWMWHPPRWKIVPNLGSSDTMAYVECGGNEAALPFEASGPWFIVNRTADGLLEEVADEEVTCSFLGQTVVVSGRSGHNQRMNGIFEELSEAYGGFPAYADHQKHLFIYRRLNSAKWVISNRLGPPIRAGRGAVFAEVEEDVPQPYLVRRPWTVHAWAGHPTELDPNIAVFLRAETFKDGPPPAVLTVRSRLHPQTAGTYTMEGGQLVNDCAVYSRAPEGPGGSEKFLFWDGERWCISGSTEHRRKQCDTCSQKREPLGRYYPDCAVWPGIEVLPGDAGVIGVGLLASLRGRISSLAKHYS